MKIRNLTMALCWGTLIGVSATSVASPTVASCDGYNNADVTLWARLVSGVERQTFDVTVKAPAGNARRLGRTWNVMVGQRRVGALKLSPNADGRLSGSLSFDSNSTPAYRNPGSAPFPRNWPAVGSGTLVRVGNLSCRLNG
ncbi:MAG: hypothetical protein QNJ91_05795 [Gammaproteobacteria bacterium]|nr:hypothetical protein [Gammaproteobacteria bacterium]